MQMSTASRLSWAAFGLVTLCFAGALVLSVLRATATSPSNWSAIVEPSWFALAMLTFPVVGVLIASRQPRNTIGWILLAIGLAWALIGVAEGYTELLGFNTDPASLPRPDVVFALTSSAWVPAVGLLGTFLLMLFPDGRLPSRRWRPLAWLSAVVLILLTILSPFMPGTLPEITGDPSLPEVPNPVGIEALQPLVGPLNVPVGLLPLCMVGSALSLIGRYRRSRSRERLQLKWLAAGAGMTAVLFLILMAAGGAQFAGWWTLPGWWPTFEFITVYSFVLIPVAVGMAILKHRLYDIDLLINRALVYGALTASLGLVYVGGVVGVSAIVRVITRQESGSLAVAASTLGVAALFGPLRRGVQSFIDRRFYRRKYDAEQTLADFSARMREQVDLESLHAELVAAVTRTMQPTHASLWLRPPRA